ncbi:hypothetical protein DV735_g1602, partial [Chaetothyriales sp. CBS 134920]
MLGWAPGRYTSFSLPSWMWSLRVMTSKTDVFGDSREQDHVTRVQQRCFGTTYKTVIDAIGPNKFAVEQPSGLAIYDDATIGSKYAALATALKENPVKGKKALKGLMDAHLHTTIYQAI